MVEFTIKIGISMVHLKHHLASPSAASKTNPLPPCLTQHRLKAVVTAVSVSIEEGHGSYDTSSWLPPLRGELHTSFRGGRGIT